MTRVISLFKSQEEATRALDALHTRDYENIEIEVIDNARGIDERGSGIVAPAPNASTGVAGTIGMPNPLQDIDLEDEEAAWFADGVRGGGVLVVAEVDDEGTRSVKKILGEHGGRTYKKE